MLKALELTGFKSFADKTRFDFPAGITVVVGPNGSGKSNIVDAIKWVLGEQSAKSLRGKEMADVIFKGSGGGLRRPSNTAEATIIFDNTGGQLALEAPEVHVTRRVYRSGEGEYLINRQACRLRDVRDLFRGTGVGADAYSLIEQGKVDTLLQASPRDRRAIFEEAAGISRFKAKKVEAQRRLERVDQNLLRLSDIVDEVDRRLRTVRSQATKARRYKEHTARLQQLRTHVGRVDWKRLTEKLSAMQAKLTQLEEEAAAISAQQEAVEARVLELDAEGTLSGEQLRMCEARTARVRERIATCESSREHEQRRLADLDNEVGRQRLRLAALSTKAGDLQDQLRETKQALVAAEEQFQRVEHEHLQQETALQGLDEQLGQLRQQTESDREKYLSQMRASATLGNQISAVESRQTSADAAIQRHTRELAELAALYEAADSELSQLQSDEARLEQAVQLSSAELEASQSALQLSRRQLAERLDELADARGQRAAAQQRAAVLEDCESRLEGISAGVKHVLSRARDESTGPFTDVRGLVADLIEVHVEMAPLVDVALGDRSQYVVVAGDGMLAHLESGQCRIAGRVFFLPVGSPPNFRAARRGMFVDQPGVIGCADQFIQTQPEYQPLLTRLLGDTWFVETLADAFRLRPTVLAAGLRFVTRAGEMIDSDGGILVGPRHAAVGLVSRRSQLRALRDEIVKWDSRIDELKRESAELRESIEKQDREVLRLTRRHEEASSAWSAHRAQANAARRRHEELGHRISAGEVELDAARQQLSAASGELSAKREEREKLEALLADLDARIRLTDQRTSALETQRRGILREATATKVELAKSEQRLEGLRAQMAQFQRDQEERSKTLAETRSGLREVQQRRTSAQRAILAASSSLAGLYLDVESLLRESASLANRRQELGLEKTKTRGQLQQLRLRLRENEDQQHRKQLDAGELRHQRSALAERLRDDYQIDLADLEDEPADDLHHQREEIDAEIDQLRRKINNIGPVNMDALAELEQLEQRFESLSTQYRDLVDAKESLERIIQKINADSRRLFSETLEAIRANFQTMFRKVFGGGNADIVLEEDVDLLESGIDIVATPPGKQPLGLSLLSGGERALTAVTLLLAVFQYRPSPFCVLDEVDGPLDEANIGRFIDVLREFLDWTKFVVVTHSKKTMTAATTLYGITMQESGVSKRVSVQFDDVTEDGHIRHEALQRDIAAAAASGEDERGAA